MSDQGTRQALTRRALLAGGGTAAVLAALGADAGAAHAAVAWNHPFTHRRTIPLGGGYRDDFYMSNGRIIKRANLHSGIDLNGTFGTAVYSCAPGLVTHAGLGTSDWGYWVEVKHADNTRTAYAHLQAGSIRVSVGQTIGTVVIGRVGGSGVGGADQYAPHLHLVKKSATGALMDPTYLAAAPLATQGAAEQPNSDWKDDNMPQLYHKLGTSPLLFALAGASPGTPANWLETTDYNGLAVPFAQRYGNSIALSAGTFDAWKAMYLSPLKTDEVP